MDVNFSVVLRRRLRGAERSVGLRRAQSRLEMVGGRESRLWL